MVACPAHHLTEPPAAPRYKAARFVESATVPGFRSPAPTATMLVQVHPIVVRHAFHTWLHTRAVRETISYLRDDRTPAAAVPRLLERLRYYRRLHTEAIRYARAAAAPATALKAAA